MATILITGFAGGLARRVARRLLDAGHAVVGVDYRDAPALDGVTLYRDVPPFRGINPLITCNDVSSQSVSVYSERIW